MKNTLFAGILLALVTGLSVSPIGSRAAAPAPPPASLASLAEALAIHENSVPGLKPQNEAHFRFWGASAPTERAFVYLHGFSASPREASPLVEKLADHFKANAYFPRLSGHGIAGGDGMRGIMLAQWQADARAALDTGRHLGKKVVVVAMSTGASLAIPAVLERSAQIEALVLLSPNFGVEQWQSELLRLPGAYALARMVIGPYRDWTPRKPEQEKYWSTRYVSTAAVEAVRAAVAARQSALERLAVPVLVAYSPHDDVVSVSRIRTAVDRISSRKETWEMPAEDSHVIAGRILSPGNTEKLIDLISKFLGSPGAASPTSAR